jgi:hypothetical protein
MEDEDEFWKELGRENDEEFKKECRKLIKRAAQLAEKSKIIQEHKRKMGQLEKAVDGCVKSIIADMMEERNIKRS